MRHGERHRDCRRHIKGNPATAVEAALSDESAAVHVKAARGVARNGAPGVSGIDDAAGRYWCADQIVKKIAQYVRPCLALRGQEDRPARPAGRQHTHHRFIARGFACGEQVFRLQLHQCGVQLSRVIVIPPAACPCRGFPALHDSGGGARLVIEDLRKLAYGTLNMLAERQRKAGGIDGPCGTPP